MVKLSPDTFPSALNNDAHTGYNFADRKVVGFSHVRYGGMGAKGMGGHISLMPCIGSLSLLPERYAAGLDKREEVAWPGYYHVQLDSGIVVELTATPHVGWHRYSFPADAADPHVLLDLNRGLTEVTDARLAVTGERTFEGWVKPRHRFDKNQTYQLFFAGEWRSPPLRHALWKNANLTTGAAEETGAAIGGVFWFDSGGSDPLLLKIALSTLSEAAARATLEAEAPGWDFDTVMRSTRQSWAERLDRIEVTGSDPAQRRLFYTALYRALAEPMDVTGPDCQYLSHAMTVECARGWRFYDGYSLWDEFRTKFPLLSLVAPDVMRDVVRSLADGESRTHTGTFPFLVVRMDMAAPVLLDAAAKGLADFDLNPAVQGLIRTAEAQTFTDYDQVGFMPGRPDRTLEASYYDWCVAELAGRLGRTDDEARFRRRAQFYHNVWNPQTRHFQPRERGGEWHQQGDPDDFDKRAWYEGTPAQWRWFVPHDPDGLIQLFGGREAFVDELERYFENHQHSMVNEVALHAPALFCAAGRLDLAQRWAYTFLTQPIQHRFGAKKRLDQPYTRRTFQPSPDGLLPEMDDDGGTMSAWFVWNAMGLYPLCPGQPRYALGWPLFERVVIHIDRDTSFVIERAQDTRPGAPNARALLNGAPLAEPFISHEQIMSGGVLRFE
ncbi:MAG: GH92 family glycosyl hydrolase [Candidatus Sumerlaeia bacterium]